jgi:hypothetical protein
MWHRVEVVLTDVSEERIASRLTPLLHGATFQKTAFFIVTAVKTSNLIFTIHVVHTFYDPVKKHKVGSTVDTPVYIVP